VGFFSTSMMSSTLKLDGFCRGVRADLFLLAGQVGKLIVAVEMHLVGASAGLPALEQAHGLRIC
jgi:hypothetical protein